MDNRRRDYRHYFEPHERVAVELSGLTEVPVMGWIANLSLGGMKVLLQDPTAQLRVDEQMDVAFFVQPGKMQLTFKAVVNHAQNWEGRTYYSFRFLPLRELTANELRERALWLFLLNEQRRHRDQVHLLAKQRREV